MKRQHIFLGFIAVATFLFISCSKDFVDVKPLSSITPDDFFQDESQVASYSTNFYSQFFWGPGYGTYFYATDVNTDNMVTRDFSNSYAKGQYKVPGDGGNWEFSGIRSVNYFFQQVLPKYKAGKITGSDDMIKHDIGEAYFFRAYLYFQKLQSFGDFPIVKTILPTDVAVLTEASKRSPRNEVARFIISDLDSAILLMQPTSPDGKNNRLSKNVAQLFKSRVALFEATWLKYFKGTAFVPKSTNWPGAAKDYNKSYVFPTGSIEGEITYFLDQAMASSKVVADNVPLVNNTKKIQQSPTDASNPYFDMFGDVDMSVYPEVLLWKRYNSGLLIRNNSPREAIGSNQPWGSPTGLTKGMVDNFLMANGLPIYASGSEYLGDDSLQQVIVGRDDRLHQFLQIPYRKYILFPLATGGDPQPWFARPQMTVSLVSGVKTTLSFTGYLICKGVNYHEVEQDNSVGGQAGLITFRAVEAYLNYIEASYEKIGTLDADAAKYWRLIRDRAGVDINFSKTIAATVMSKEALGDWGAYSGGQLIDATLFNIRRERRCEMLGEEGIRQMDLNRWRSKDQLIAAPYHPEGFKLWGPMLAWEQGISDLKYDVGDASTVSSPSVSLYLRPYEKSPNHFLAGGMTWKMAHYLEPIAIQHFRITSQNNDPATSPIYQNPGWGLVPNLPALN